jgi:ethanolamine ammonia-lyase large subunit
VYLQYRRAKGDDRPDRAVIEESEAKMDRVRGRGVFLATGHGANSWDLDPALDREVRTLYEDAKVCIRAELPSSFPATLPAAVPVVTRSHDRDDYILHPPTGEVLDMQSLDRIATLRAAQAGRYNVQIVVSDGLNAYALTDRGHLTPYLDELRRGLTAAHLRPAPEHIVVTTGRVRAGYRIGELLFAGRQAGDSAVVVHVIGERPGNGHHTFSAYVTKLRASVWSQSGVVDHNHTKVISNIADTALDPVLAAQQTVALSTLVS